MKKTSFLILVLALTTIHSLNAVNTKTGKSFMFTRPLYHNVNIERAIWHGLMDTKEKQTRIQIIPIFQKSFESESIKKYFLLGDKTELLVTGDSATSVADRDIRAEWLGIDNGSHNFSGTMSVKPEQTQYGAIGEFNVNLRELVPWKFLENFWVGVTVPFVHVKNNLNLSQSQVENKGTGGPKDILEAFAGKTKPNNADPLSFARMDAEERSGTGVPEIRLKFGAQYESENGIKLGNQTFFVIPLTEVPDSKYVFSPLLGNNKHYGMGSTVNFEVPLCNPTDNSECSFFLDGSTVFYLTRTQTRTFDLFNKPFSRYIQVRKEGTSETIPAANILTLDVKADPFNYGEISTGFRLNFDNFETQFGYGLWAHGEEKLTLKETFTTLYGIAGEGNDKSASNSTIKTKPQTTDPSPTTSTIQIKNDTEFTTIKQADIDLTSAAAQSAVVHKIQASAGWIFKKGDTTGIASLGVAIDIPHRNGAIKNVSAWGKLGFSF